MRPPLLPEAEVVRPIFRGAPEKPIAAGYGCDCRVVPSMNPSASSLLFCTCTTTTLGAVQCASSSHKLVSHLHSRLGSLLSPCCRYHGADKNCQRGNATSASPTVPQRGNTVQQSTAAGCAREQRCRYRWRCRWRCRKGPLDDDAIDVSADYPARRSTAIHREQQSGQLALWALRTRPVIAKVYQCENASVSGAARQTGSWVLLTARLGVRV